MPFTYTLTMPVLFDPGTGTVINNLGSLNDLHSVTIVDDLNATGVDLSYVSHTAYLQSTVDAPVSHTFSNVNGLLTFDNFPIITAGEQIIIELTVVLNATPVNAIGTQFINTASWDFGRLIDGEFFDPLPGENGITQPLTIGAPDVTLTKSGPATLNLGQPGVFTLDIQNAGTSDAWDLTLVDRFPDGPMGGMCDVTPTVLSAQVFASDGTTPVPGKGPLGPGDFAFTWTGTPACEMTLTMLTAEGAVGPGERLIITYQSQLDANTRDGVSLTNIAGVTEWFNGDASNPARVSFSRTVSNGSVNTLDHQDAHTLTTALSGFLYEKSVQNLTSGANPAATAAAGDVLRYTLRLQTTTSPAIDLTFFDDVGALNALPVFVPGSLALVPGSIPPGADTSNTNPNGGTNGAGIIDVRNLNAPVDSEIIVQFDITLDPTLADGVIVTNQADLISSVKIGDSDDPNINGQADPNVAGDEDPTRIIIASIPAPPLLKETTQATAAIGEPFRYRITVPETPHPFDLFDVRITDDLTASASMQLLGVTKISGSGAWTPINTGPVTNPVIEDPTIGIDIPAGEQIVLELTVALADVAGNTTGLVFTNTADYVYNAVDGDVVSQRSGQPGTSGPMTIVGPDTVIVTKTGPGNMTLGTPGSYRLDAQNTGTGPAWNMTLIDQLPSIATGGTCAVSPTVTSVQVFQSNGTTPVSAPLVLGTDYSLSFRPSPVCEFEFTMLSAAAVVGPTERLIVDYDVSLDPSTQSGAMLTNVAGAVQWFSAALDPQTTRRTFSEVLTNGTTSTADHEDAHTTLSILPLLRFEKTVRNLTTGQNPATSASPGDTLRYTLTVENVGAPGFPAFSLNDELDALNFPPVFAPNTLNVVSMPPGAVSSGTNPTGGASGTGVLDVTGLSVVNSGDIAVVEFDVTLAAAIANGTNATNQSQLLVGGTVVADSDDPTNGPADPLIPGDEDPTVVPIVSAPMLLVEKTSADLTGDPAILLPGDTLRYTITVENVGSAHVLDASLRDAVPVNTTYVAGSTSLNGIAVPDGAGGTSPLGAGILINAPSDPTPGTLRADGIAGTEVATVVFDVVIDPGVIDGTIISNQAFASALAGGIVDQPSDDPTTPIANDPTLDVVGSVPLLFAPKSVALAIDNGSPGVVDPLDTLHYTITVFNTGSVPATAATLVDAVPAGTSWVADSLLLNGIPVGVPDGGNSPLAAGIGIASSDVTPPLPGAAGGTINPGQSAVIEFDLLVLGTTTPGTLISKPGNRR